MSLRKAIKSGLTIALAIGVSSCAASPESTSTSADSSSPTNATDASLMSARVQFDFQDFYSLTSPNAAGCAGDVLNLYDPVAARSPASMAPVPFANAGGAYGGTYRPAFIKNVSVDLTDAGSPAPGNLASGCSTGITPSACATFDYGASGGVSSTLAGSMLLVGGIQNSNYSGINGSVTDYGLSVSCGPVNGSFATSCGTSLYAVGVDGLPASAATDPPNTLVPGLDSAAGPITGFVNLAAQSGFGSVSDPGPTDFIAGAGAYDPGIASLAAFGGTSVIGALGGALSANGESAPNDTTWIFNLATQKWTQIPPAPNIATALEETFEQISAGDSHNLSNLVTGRANFGYAAVQGLSLSAMSASGGVPVFPGPGAGPVDSTDRIVIAGGQDASGFLGDSYKFNPTYGPEWVDTMARSVHSPLSAGEPAQWLVSYTTVPLFDTTSAAELMPMYHGSATPVLSTNFGLAPLRDNNAADYGAGYPLFVGGFDTTQATGVNPNANSCPGVPGQSCGMMIGARTGRLLSAAGAGSTEKNTANFSSVGNLLESYISLGLGTNTQLTPTSWSTYTDAGASSVPWFGGATLLPGFNLDTNDTVFFGGGSCESYLLSSTSGCAFNNPGAYTSMGADPVANGGITSVPASVAMAGAPPQRAGMASARGTDPSGNVVVVAFGGMSAAGSGTDQGIYYLWNNAGTPTWVYVPTPTGPGPNVPTNGAMVFSHVTKNFYLFGGYSSVSGTMQGDTWELSLSPNACAASGTCFFTWKQLNVTGGTSCSPDCPPARRSHRMLEVNYANRNPGGTIGGVTSGESVCSNTAPCSYGIFMEGGTTDGVTLLNDRWMFDPTANNGYGSWQQMHEMPGRNLSAMASADYTVAGSENTVHRAILFGGETGLANPAQALASAGQYYVPPTLGDTWMYDFDNSSWNRVQLLGEGYNGLPAFVGGEEFTVRQAYDATDATGGGANTDQREVVGGVNHISELSPPPSSGAVMITRSTPALAIPEIYLLGGRLKDGSFQPLDHVYKFCAGSTGESYSNASPGAPNDGTHAAADFTCDAYNAATNAFSPSPSSQYFGRWLRKAPPTGATLSSFMGAGAYDPIDDLALVFGGLQFNTLNTAVTDPAQRVTQLAAQLTPSIYEYAFPSIAAPQGAWSVAGACAGSPTPTPRYGESMVYNTALQKLVVIGGYDINGTPLTQTVSGASGSYQLPDMWEATREAGPCYQWSQINTIGNSIAGSEAPPMTGLSHMIAVYVPPTGYGKDYYSTYDSSCAGVGPIKSDDPSQSKLLAGGVYFDIDRTQLGPNENLLLNLTFMPLDASNQGPSGANLPSSARAYFRIHLVKTGETPAELEETPQPRYLTYTGNSDFPQTVQSLSVIAPPTGQIQQQQILIPLTADPGIDRIRIERFSGNAILIDAALYRMGYR